jgi:hypothetical protein
MGRRAGLAVSILLFLYVVAGNLLGCLSFIFGVDTGDKLFFAFYPCTVFWSVAYFTGPLWTIGGIVVASAQLWMVFKFFESYYKKSEVPAVSENAADAR